VTYGQRRGEGERGDRRRFVFGVCVGFVVIAVCQVGEQKAVQRERGQDPCKRSSGKLNRQRHRGIIHSSRLVLITIQKSTRGKKYSKEGD